MLSQRRWEHGVQVVQVLVIYVIDALLAAREESFYNRRETWERWWKKQRHNIRDGPEYMSAHWRYGSLPSSTFKVAWEKSSGESQRERGKLPLFQHEWRLPNLICDYFSCGLHTAIKLNILLLKNDWLKSWNKKGSVLPVTFIIRRRLS